MVRGVWANLFFRGCCGNLIIKEVSKEGGAVHE